MTKTLLFVTQDRGMGDENTPRINVFDKRNGELLGHIPLPETANGSPITYSVAGRQYLAVAPAGRRPLFGGYSQDVEDFCRSSASPAEGDRQPGATEPSPDRPAPAVKGEAR